MLSPFDMAKMQVVRSGSLTDVSLQVISFSLYLVSGYFQSMNWFKICPGAGQSADELCPGTRTAKPLDFPETSSITVRLQQFQSSEVRHNHHSTSSRFPNQPSQATKR
jgi:hypothetical protein